MSAEPSTISESTTSASSTGGSLAANPKPLEFAFDPKALQRLAARLKDEYARADPFPHVVLDDFLPREVTQAALDEFPPPEAIRWGKMNISQEKKLSTNDTRLMGPATRVLIGEMNSAPFLDFLQTLTGIPALIPDARLEGGGLHQIEAGGYLHLHADFNKHMHWGLDRRLNVLLYLNRDWRPEWGGDFELWDRAMTRCVRKVAPVFNRLVVFSTTDSSWHGHPDPLQCPRDRARKSIALYYYSNGRPAEEASEAHTTLFQDRPGERKRLTFQGALRSLTPPALLVAKGHLRHNPRLFLKFLSPPVLLAAFRTLKGIARGGK